MTFEDLFLTIRKVKWNIDQLPPAQRKIIRARWGFSFRGHKTLREVAEKYGVSFQRVSEIEKKVMEEIEKDIENIENFNNTIKVEKK